MRLNLQEKVLLSEYSTIGLGGKADYFCECNSHEEIISAIEYAKEQNLRMLVISGGSNIIFPDEGFKGIVLKINLKGMGFFEKENFVEAKVSAGESWDDFVIKCIDKNLSGIECMSGIPGSAGATPIQNVGAYGQEVNQTLISVNAIEKKFLKEVLFKNEECKFSYRESRFKSIDKDKFIITGVTFRFKKNEVPEIRYEELRNYIETNYPHYLTASLNEQLQIIRNSVLTLRKTKSMILDPDDANSKSCGSFFKNPVLSQSEYEKFVSVMRNDSYLNIPVFKSGSRYKIPAAWLVEKSGFKKGYISNGVGISKNHSLALININGTTKELLALADEIETKVFKKFGIHLEKEPVIV